MLPVGVVICVATRSHFRTVWSKFTWFETVFGYITLTSVDAGHPVASLSEQ